MKLIASGCDLTLNIDEHIVIFVFRPTSEASSVAMSEGSDQRQGDV